MGVSCEGFSPVKPRSGGRSCCTSDVWRRLSMNNVANLSWWSVGVLIAIVVLALVLYNR